DSEVAELRELMQQRRRGRDRIGAEEHRPVGQLRARREPERERLAAANAAVFAGRECGLAGLQMRDGGRKLRGLAVGMTGAERGQVRLAYRVVLCEAFLDPGLDRAEISV